MKKISLIALLVGISGAFGIAQAATVTATSIPNMVYTSGYEWGITPTVASGYQLASASITLNATVYNTTSGILFLSLLDASPVSGITSTAGNTETGVDFWSTKSAFSVKNSAGYSEYTSLGGLDYGSSWGSNDNDGKTITVTLNSAQLAALNSYLTATTPNTSGGFDIGFDPDCTYDFSSLSFTYTTTKSNGSGSVPDVSVTAFLLALGLFSVECCRRKFAFSK